MNENVWRDLPDGAVESGCQLCKPVPPSALPSGSTYHIRCQIYIQILLLERNKI